MTTLISVIVTTYNRADALNATLRALAHQTDRNFEIVVGDDGSGPEVARLIRDWAQRLPVPINFIWHRHEGFRLSEIRNRAICASAGSLCIFLDGDCMVRPDFIALHRRLAEPGWFVSGNRILLSRELTQRVLAGQAEPEAWDIFRLAVERWRGGVNRLLPAYRLPLGPLRRLFSKTWQGVQGCNLSVARSDLDRVDGFDSSYTGWGLEDSDIVVRLLHAGVRRKDGRFATGVLHLWHPPNDRALFAANRARLEDLIHSNRVRALHGLSSLAAADVDASIKGGP